MHESCLQSNSYRYPLPMMQDFLYRSVQYVGCQDLWPGNGPSGLHWQIEGCTEHPVPSIHLGNLQSAKPIETNWNSSQKNDVSQKLHSKIALQAKILDNQQGPTRHRSSSLRGIYSLVFEIQRPCSPARWLAAQHLRTNVPALNVQKMTSTESESNPSHKAPARCKP